MEQPQELMVTDDFLKSAFVYPDPFYGAMGYIKVKNKTPRVNMTVFPSKTSKIQNKIRSQYIGK